MPLLIDNTVLESTVTVLPTIESSAKSSLYFDKDADGCKVRKMIYLMFVGMANYNELDIATKDCNCLKSTLNFTQSCED